MPPKSIAAKEHKRAYYAAWRAAHPDKVRDNNAANRAKLRTEAHKAYGDCCIGCGATENSDMAAKEHDRAYQAAYRAAHPEEYRAYQSAYRAAHPEELRAYRTARLEKDRAYQAAYYAAHREKLLARHKAWAKANRDKVKAVDA
jgi:hypothetical protein